MHECLYLSVNEGFLFFFLDQFKSGSKGLRCFDITTRWLLRRLECKYSRLFVRRLVVWWAIKAGRIHEAAELLAPSNNADPRIRLLLSVHLTISGWVNYSRMETVFNVIGMCISQSHWWFFFLIYMFLIPHPQPHRVAFSVKFKYYAECFVSEWRQIFFFFFHVAVFCLAISSIYILCRVSKPCGCFDSFHGSWDRRVERSPCEHVKVLWCRTYPPTSHLLPSACWDTLQSHVTLSLSRASENQETEPGS